MSVLPAVENPCLQPRENPGTMQPSLPALEKLLSPLSWVVTRMTPPDPAEPILSAAGGAGERLEGRHLRLPKGTRHD